MGKGKKKRRQRGDASSRGGCCSPALRSMTPSLPTPCSCQNPPCQTLPGLCLRQGTATKKKKKKQQVRVHPICSASTEETEAISSSKRVTKLPFPKPSGSRGRLEGCKTSKHPNALRASRERAAADAGEVKPYHEPPGSTAVPGGAV